MSRSVLRRRCARLNCGQRAVSPFVLVVPLGDIFNQADMVIVRHLTLV